MAERRINDRFREANRVAVTIISASGAPDLINRTFFCPTADLSRSGLRLTVHIGVPVGAELELRIAFLKPLRTFTHAGRVVWVRKENHDRFPYALGVEFTALEPAAEEIWEQIIEQKLLRRMPDLDNDAETGQ